MVKEEDAFESELLRPSPFGSEARQVSVLLHERRYPKA
jgi:hypothetical protein